MATKQEVNRVMQYLLARYPGKFQVITVGEFTTADTWADVLADVPADVLLAAARQYASEAHDWPPDAGQLRERATVLTRPALPAWSDAWDEVLNAVRFTGYTGKPVFSHPLIAQAVQGMGGWLTMCQMTIDETATWRAQFRDIFNAYASRATRDANLLPDVRALAVKNGALPAPTAAVAALPAPERQAAPALEATQPIKFAEFVKRHRAAQQAEREAHGRAMAEQAEQEAAHA